MPQQPVFGKRSASARPRPGVPAGAAPLAPETVAFFATARAEAESAHSRQAVVVPRSGRAAFLAALVVGCMLAGFAVTGDGDGARAMASLRTLGFDPARLLPASILLGLFAGARASAMTTVAVRGLLHKAGHTSHVAYALGGAAASFGLAAAILGLFGHAPAHGLAIEALSGAGSGFFYRVFAGSRPPG